MSKTHDIRKKDDDFEVVDDMRPIVTARQQQIDDIEETSFGIE